MRIKVIEIFKFIGKDIITPIIVTILTLVLVKNYFDKPKDPNIYSNITYNSGFLKTKIKSPFTIDYKDDKKPFLILFVNNTGETGETDIDIQIKLNNQKILKSTITYEPEVLKNKSKLINSDSASYYENISSLPSESSINYEFILNDYILDENDIKYSVLSPRKNWTGHSEIKITQFSLNIITNNLFAQELPIIIKKEDLPKSGIYIGGYDPLVMVNGIFLLLQKKTLINNVEADNIKKSIEKYKKGVLFGGVNILKLNELILNILIKRKLITKAQATDILTISNKAGGIKIGNYNIIILQIEILNKLLINKKIHFKEGQNIIDISKR